MRLAILITIQVFWMNAEALRCWTCKNAGSNAECQRLGKLRSCLRNENACINELRREKHGMTLSKGCKQERACVNNVIQNPKEAWHPTQCNNQSSSSVCRCCCTFDGCNVDVKCNAAQKKVYDCRRLASPQHGRKSCDYTRREGELGSTCEFSCDENYRRVGAERSICRMTSTRRSRFSRPTPTCVFVPKNCKPVKPPLHGSMFCTYGAKAGSMCSFKCDAFFTINENSQNPVVIPSPHELEGEKEITCEPTTGNWTAPPPTCVAVICPDLLLPENLEMSCTYANFEGSVCSFKCVDGYEVIGSSSTTCDHVPTGGVWTDPVPTCRRIECQDFPPNPINGRISCSNGKYLHSECKFDCVSGYKRVGSDVTRCVEENGKVRSWSHIFPVCKRIRCPRQFLRNGRINCTNENYESSVCSYECVTEGFSLDPPEVTSAMCTENSVWNVSKPCCSRICPPFSVVDLVFAIDSSSSIGEENWETITAFVKSIIETFVIGDDASRVGAFRYNRNIDTRSQILLRDYPDNRTQLLEAFDRVPYDGEGTFTGQALVHARNVMFHPSNGNRPDVPDYLIVITDGTSFDSVSRGARLLRESHVHVFAIGVLAKDGRLNYDQLRELVTHEDDLIIAADGFDDLNANLFNDLVEIVCRPGCDIEL